jgi:hypothetical protein
MLIQWKKYPLDHQQSWALISQDPIIKDKIGKKKKIKS